MAQPQTASAAPPNLGYAGAAAGPAYEFWREEFCRRIMVVDLVPIGTGPVRCDITPRQLPNVRMSCSTGTAMKFTSMGANSDLVLLMAPSSPLHAFMGRHSLDIPPLGISIGDAAVKGAYVSQLQDGGFKTALLDRRLLLTLCPTAEDKVARPIAQNPALASLLHHYYDVLVQLAPRLDPAAQQAAAQHLVDLVALSIGTGRDQTELARTRGLRAAKLEAIKSSILLQLGQGDLTLTKVANLHKVSARYVQMLFEQAGESFSAFILEHRLLHAARLLRGPNYGNYKISVIADMAGFNDTSYFYRAFQRRFNMTPADMREAARRAAEND